jgi:hypothetical protein
MDTLKKLEALRVEKATLLSEGEALQDCWIGYSRPGGTASIKGKLTPHAQLRSRSPVFSGRKSRYLKADEVADFEAAIARGRKVRKLEKAIEKLKQQLGAADDQ